MSFGNYVGRKVKWELQLSRLRGRIEKVNPTEQSKPLIEKGLFDSAARPLSENVEEMDRKM
jgi:hypothetical protein